MSNNEDLAELQSRFAFQEDAVNTLNDIVARQDQEIVKMRSQLNALNKKIEELKQSSEDGLASSVSQQHEKPPHY